MSRSVITINEALNVLKFRILTKVLNITETTENSGKITLLTLSRNFSSFNRNSLYQVNFSEIGLAHFVNILEKKRPYYRPTQKNKKKKDLSNPHVEVSSYLSNPHAKESGQKTWAEHFDKVYGLRFFTDLQRIIKPMDHVISILHIDKYNQITKVFPTTIISVI